jgi:hypothetical protein
MFQWLLYFALVLGLFPLSILIIRKKAAIKTTFIFPFLFIVFMASLYEGLATIMYQVPTILWFRVYLFLEFLALAYYFYHLLKRKFKFFFSFSVISYCILFIVLIPYLYNGHNLLADAYLSIFEVVFVYIGVIIWFRDTFRELAEESMLHIPHFYFISGLLMYFSGTLFLYLLGDRFLHDASISFESYWSLNIIFNIILRLFLIAGAWKMK